MNVSKRKSDLVHVNGIHLHYLDGGGSAPTLSFLTGMGSSAYIFSKFAPRFTDRFRTDTIIVSSPRKNWSIMKCESFCLINSVLRILSSEKRVDVARSGYISSIYRRIIK